MGEKEEMLDCAMFSFLFTSAMQTERRMSCVRFMVRSFLFEWTRSYSFLFKSELLIYDRITCHEKVDLNPFVTLEEIAMKHAGEVRCNQADLDVGRGDHGELRGGGA